MPFIQPIDEAYIKVTKVHVQDGASNVTSVGNFRYRIELPEMIQKVIGMQVTAYNFSEGIMPTFYPAVADRAGANTVDFSLTNTDISGSAGVFSFTWSSKLYEYINDFDTRSYVKELVSLMNEQIDADATWGGRVKIVYYRHPTQRTFLGATTISTPTPGDITTSVTYLTLLFGTGANVANSAASLMGFTPGVDISSTLTTLYFDTNVTFLESPSATSLRTFPYIDINVEECSTQPLLRVFSEDKRYTRARKETNYSKQVRFDLDKPQRNLRFINASITFPDGNFPDYYLGNSDALVQHFTIEVYSLVDTFDPDEYLRMQRFTY